MNILEEICLWKKEEISQRKVERSIRDLEKQVNFKREGISLQARMQSAKAPSVIAEFKRKSPSKGILNNKVSIHDMLTCYQNDGASAVSILTDIKYFSGTIEDLEHGRTFVTHTPILRKDFMIDEYQFIEAKSFGADIVLLIAAMLSKKEIIAFTRLSKSLGLEVLLEIHSSDELQEKFFDEVSFIGVNNRNLKTFEVDINTSFQIAEMIPHDVLKISESGLKDVATISSLYQAGYKGFLIGETFMKNEYPTNVFHAFMNEIKLL